MTRVCVNHKELPSATMCFQCHKPVCKSCTIVMPQGSFEDLRLEKEDVPGGVRLVAIVVERPRIADLEFRGNKKLTTSQLKDKLKEARSVGGGFFTKASAVFVLMIIGFMAVHAAVSFGASSLRKIDVIGLILNLARSPKEGAGR